MAWYAEVLNITNAQNVFTYIYSSGDPSKMIPPAQSQVDHLPIRPFIGLRTEY